MLVRPLTTNERAETPGFTHVARITADDLTTTANATAQAITLCALKALDVVGRVMGIARTPFQNTADAAFNSDTVSIGDSGSATRWGAGVEANANGTFLNQFSTTAVLYTANDSLIVTINSMTAKALNNINRGEYYVLFQLIRALDVVNAIAAARISKT